MKKCVSKAMDRTKRKERKDILYRKDHGHFVVTGHIPGTRVCLWCGRNPDAFRYVGLGRFMYGAVAPCRYSEV